MQYMLLLYGDESGWAAMNEEETAAVFAEYGKLDEFFKSRGSEVQGAELQPTSTATTLRVRDGETLVTDGPFAETKEQLGGYFVVDCASLDEALEVAARIPAAKDGSIEVRPVMQR
ncbi:MAG: YciI family protein [Euzebyales bacterium]|nr:YciI family protein [Euzebyales bacterium]